MEEKIKEVLAKEGFVEKMLECEEPEQVQALFAAEGVELSLEDIKAVGQSLNMRGGVGATDDKSLSNGLRDAAEVGDDNAVTLLLLKADDDAVDESLC